MSALFDPNFFEDKNSNNYVGDSFETPQSLRVSGENQGSGVARSFAPQEEEKRKPETNENRLDTAKRAKSKARAYARRTERKNGNAQTSSRRGLRLR